MAMVTAAIAAAAGLTLALICYFAFRSRRPFLFTFLLGLLLALVAAQARS